MDKVLDKIVALGVPGLVLMVAVNLSGWTGAAALTSSLALFGGPCGMVGGLFVLGAVGLISKGLADQGFEAIFRTTVDDLKKKGKSKSDIEREIDAYPISHELKLKIKDYLQKFA